MAAYSMAGGSMKMAAESCNGALANGVSAWRNGLWLASNGNINNVNTILNNMWRINQ
jgi:hypothetical protein